MTPAQNVDVEMIDGLAAVRAGVDHHAVAVSETLVAGNLRRREQQVSEQPRMLFAGVRQRGNMFPGHHKKVHRRLRVDVAERDAAVVLVDGLGRD